MQLLKISNKLNSKYPLLICKASSIEDNNTIHFCNEIKNKYGIEAYRPDYFEMVFLDNDNANQSESINNTINYIIELIKEYHSLLIQNKFLITTNNKKAQTDVYHRIQVCISKLSKDYSLIAQQLSEYFDENVTDISAIQYNNIQQKYIDKIQQLSYLVENNISGNTNRKTQLNNKSIGIIRNNNINHINRIGNNSLDNKYTNNIYSVKNDLQITTTQYNNIVSHFDKLSLNSSIYNNNNELSKNAQNYYNYYNNLDDNTNTELINRFVYDIKNSVEDIVNIELYKDGKVDIYNTKDTFEVSATKIDNNIVQNNNIYNVVLENVVDTLNKKITLLFPKITQSLSQQIVNTLNTFSSKMTQYIVNDILYKNNTNAIINQENNIQDVREFIHNELNNIQTKIKKEDNVSNSLTSILLIHNIINSNENFIKNVDNSNTFSLPYTESNYLNVNNSIYSPVEFIKDSIGNYNNSINNIKTVNKSTYNIIEKSFNTTFRKIDVNNLKRVKSNKDVLTENNYIANQRIDSNTIIDKKHQENTDVLIIKNDYYKELLNKYLNVYDNNVLERVSNNINTISSNNNFNDYNLNTKLSYIDNKNQYDMYEDVAFNYFNDTNNKDIYNNENVLNNNDKVTNINNNYINNQIINNDTIDINKSTSTTDILRKEFVNNNIENRLSNNTVQNIINDSDKLFKQYIWLNENQKTQLDNNIINDFYRYNIDKINLKKILETKVYNTFPNISHDIAKDVVNEIYSIANNYSIVANEYNDNTQSLQDIGITNINKQKVIKQFNYIISKLENSIKNDTTNIQKRLALILLTQRQIKNVNAANDIDYNLTMSNNVNALSNNNNIKIVTGITGNAKKYLQESAIFITKNNYYNELLNSYLNTQQNEQTNYNNKTSNGVLVNNVNAYDTDTFVKQYNSKEYLPYENIAFNYFNYNNNIEDIDNVRNVLVDDKQSNQVITNNVEKHNLTKNILQNIINKINVKKTTGILGGSKNYLKSKVIFTARNNYYNELFNNYLKVSNNIFKKYNSKNNISIDNYNNNQVSKSYNYNNNEYDYISYNDVTFDYINNNNNLSQTVNNNKSTYTTDSKSNVNYRTDKHDVNNNIVKNVVYTLDTLFKNKYIKNIILNSKKQINTIDSQRKYNNIIYNKNYTNNNVNNENTLSLFYISNNTDDVHNNSYYINNKGNTTFNKELTGLLINADTIKNIYKQINQENVNKNTNTNLVVKVWTTNPQIKVTKDYKSIFKEINERFVDSNTSGSLDYLEPEKDGERNRWQQLQDIKVNYMKPQVVQQNNNTYQLEQSDISFYPTPQMNLRVNNVLDNSNYNANVNNYQRQDNYYQDMSVINQIKRQADEAYNRNLSNKDNPFASFNAYNEVIKDNTELIHTIVSTQENKNIKNNTQDVTKNITTSVVQNIEQTQLQNLQQVNNMYNENVENLKTIINEQGKQIEKITKEQEHLKMEIISNDARQISKSVMQQFQNDIELEKMRHGYV